MWDESAWEALVGAWVYASPSREARALERRAVVSSIEDLLEGQGFTVASVGDASAPTLVARRAATSGGASIAVYNHYDVEPAGAGWSTEPRRLTLREGRYYGRGVADNLGALALRLLATRDARSAPEILWVIEGEEELGSPSLSAVRTETAARRPAMWVDETGFFESPRAQRLLSVNGDDGVAARAIDAITGRAALHGVTVATESRRMNRVSPDGRTSVESLMDGVAYLALGPNDADARIHRADESLPRWSLRLSAEQWVELLEALGGR